MPPKTDENDNGQIAELYNWIDSYAARMDAAICLIQSHLQGHVLRPYWEQSVLVLDAAVRSFRHRVANCLRQNFPTCEPIFSSRKTARWVAATFEAVPDARKQGLELIGVAVDVGNDFEPLLVPNWAAPL